MKKEKIILLVEDNEGDAELILEALNNSRTTSHVIVINNGEDAMQFLKEHEEDTQEKPLPDIILLDLNLPKLDGKEVLQYVKQNQATKRIPVIILTTSSLQKDIKDALDSHANAYIVKTGDIEHLMNLIKSIENFWVNFAIFPQKT